MHPPALIGAALVYLLCMIVWTLALLAKLLVASMNAAAGMTVPSRGASR